ncbi:25270_t:CDS:2, partial [Gigaspora rosea]
MSDSLNRFKQETQKIIIQWFKSLKENNNKNDLEEEEDDDSILLIIEWNDATLQGFNGRSRIQNNCTSNVGINVTAPSDAMFSVVDTNTSNKAQISEDIVTFLRETYFQRYRPSLGRVHEVRAIKKDCFEIKEYRN